MMAAPLLDRFTTDLAALAAEAMRSGLAGQVALYGGTFTAVPREQLQLMLDKVSPHVAVGVFTGVRFSTRPDCMGKDIRRLLADYPIETIELGVQALHDEVLVASRRGYTSLHVRRAAEAVRRGGWELGIQLMPGLPGDTRERFAETVSRTIELRPDFVRLYPTLVLTGTVLAQWYSKKAYRPITLEEAIGWCADAYERFVRADIKVVRMGLHADPALQAPGAIVAGPYHPAFGYLVKVHWWRRQVDGALANEQFTDGKTLLVKVAQRRLSEAGGPQRANPGYWMKRWGFTAVRLAGEATFADHQLEVRCI